jgi:glucose/arabinose dehydrogenase
MLALRSVVLSAALIGCTANGDVANGEASVNNAAGNAALQSEAPPFQVATLAQFDQPWAMALLPGGRQALITEKPGRLKLWTIGGAAIDVAGVPQVDYGGQGGLGDVIIHPDFATNNNVYLSWAEAGEGDRRGAAVGRGRLVVEGGAARLDGFEVIWRQQPKMTGRGHYAHRLLFSPDGRHLFVSNGDRQHFDPAQDMSASLGKIVRLNPDGSVPEDNPFAGQGEVASQIWTLGHRNPLGIAFAPDGRLWEVEMGPAGGDEMNLVVRGRNYGYPIVSNGDHYDGRPIPDHSTRPDFEAPKVTWNPVISPGAMIIYDGEMFPQWRGDALIAGLSSEALIRVDIDGDSAREANRWPMDSRIREIVQAADGSLYVLQDGEEASLLHLTARR